VKIGGVAYGDLQPGVHPRPLHSTRLHDHVARLSASVLVLLGLEEMADAEPLPIYDGWNVLDDNLLACPEWHVRAVFEMLKRQTQRVCFTGGLKRRRCRTIRSTSWRASRRGRRCSGPTIPAIPSRRWSTPRADARGRFHARIASAALLRADRLSERHVREGREAAERHGADRLHADGDALEAGGRGGDEVGTGAGVASVSTAMGAAGDHPLLVHADDVTGIGPLRQWILDNTSRTRPCSWSTTTCTRSTRSSGVRARTADRSGRRRREVVENTALCAAGAGARIFGFNQAWDVRKFLPMKPVSFTGWVGGAIGVVGRDVQFDTTLKLRADIDACLSSLLKHRIIYQELRFALRASSVRGHRAATPCRGRGRTRARDSAYLQRKWGAHLRVRRSKTAILLKVHVPRAGQAI
jgi:hypothetical protein